MNCGCASSSPCCANSIQNKTEPDLENHQQLMTTFQILKSGSSSCWLWSWVCYYFPFATTILKALDGCPFSALNDFFLCFVYYFLLQEMMMMTTTTYFVVGLLCCQLSLLLNELNFPAKNDLFVTQCQMSQVLKQPKKMLKWHMS